jgi:hypothetical protein
MENELVTYRDFFGRTEKSEVMRYNWDLENPMSKVAEALPYWVEVNYLERNRDSYLVFIELLEQNGWVRAVSKTAKALVNPMPSSAFLPLNVDFLYGAGGRDEDKGNYHHAIFVLLQNEGQYRQLVEFIEAFNKSPSPPAKLETLAQEAPSPRIQL